MAVFIDNFFNFLRIYAMSCDVLNIILVPFRVQLLKPHGCKIA